MTLLPTGHREGRMGHRHDDGGGGISWEPQLPRMQWRRRSLEQASVIAVSLNGALVRAKTNHDITRGVRVSIGLQSHRGLVAIRSIEPAPDAALSDYGVQFLWLDPAIQAFFDEMDKTESTQSSLDFAWR